MRYKKGWKLYEAVFWNKSERRFGGGSPQLKQPEIYYALIKQQSV